MKNYRKIWEKKYGNIPVDENGKKYDIHHIDGDRSNNSIDNLMAVSIKEHYHIHKNQGDWQACHVIMKRLNLSVQEQLEINKKISQIKKGRQVSEEHKRKISETLKGRKNGPCSEERKRKVSEALKGKQMWSKEDRARMSEQRKGRKLSEETKRKMSETTKGRKISDEWKQKISKSNKGRKSGMEGKKHTAETKIKMVESAKNRKQKL